MRLVSQEHRALQAELPVHDLAPSPVLSIVVPTFNEALNLPELFERLLAFTKASGLSIETIIVDDASPDGTGVLAEELAIKHDGWLSARVLHRPRKLGLSSALFDGIRMSRGQWIVTLDADNSHDIRSLADMFQAAKDGVDVVIGSRYVPGGRIEDWPVSRLVISRVATTVSRLLFRLQVEDPMSGFCMIHRDAALRLPDLLNPRAYKFLLEFLVRVRPLSVREVPIAFRNRRNGDSKLTWKEIVEFDRLVFALLRGRGSRMTSA